MKEKTTIPARQEDIWIIKDTASGKGLKKSYISKMVPCKFMLNKYRNIKQKLQFQIGKPFKTIVNLFIKQKEIPNSTPNVRNHALKNYKWHCWWKRFSIVVERKLFKIE